MTPDGLPHDLVSKVVGIALVLTCALILGTENQRGNFLLPGGSVSFHHVRYSTEVVYPQGYLQWLLVLGVLVCGFSAQYTQTYSYPKLSGIRSAIPSYTSLVNMPVLQWAIYGNLPSSIAFVGMGIVTSAGLCSAIRGVQSELTTKVTEDDIERELMLSPTASVLLSPNRDQDRLSVTSG